MRLLNTWSGRRLRGLTDGGDDALLSDAFLFVVSFVCRSIDRKVRLIL